MAKNKRMIAPVVIAIVVIVVIVVAVLNKPETVTDDIIGIVSDANRSKQREDRNISAFLKVLQYAEGTSLRSNPYAVCYGFSHTITNFADHPAITGEWRGKRLPDKLCIGAGLSPGCKSTAAGAYQFIKPTWLGLKHKLGLSDFSDHNQDKAAIELIRQKGALNDVKAGRFATAVTKCRKVWASLPGAGYSQPEKSITSLTNKFTQYGGLLA